MSQYNEVTLNIASIQRGPKSIHYCSRTKIMVVSLTGIILVAVAITIPTVVLSAKEDESKPLRVGAFNVKRFGKSKISKEEIAQALDQIFQRYDILVMQEVTDISQTSIDTFLKILRITDKYWAYVASDRLGRSSYKEQYVFYYRSNFVTVEESFQVLDSADIFEREPFAIKIRYTSASKRTSQRTALASIHVKPTDVVAELTALPSAITNISNAFTNINGVIVMGDFNADCSYLSKTSQNTLPIFSSELYRNLIPHTADTTIGKTDCAYDRVIVYGSDIDVRKSRVYKFEMDLNVNTTEALKISDHYPVEFLLY